MVKYKKDGINNLDDPLYWWLAWFDRDSPQELLKEVVRMDTAIQAADERFAHITKDEDELRAYYRYVMAECDRTGQIDYARSEGRTEGRTEGHAEGHAEGRFEEKYKIARNMLSEDLPHELIHRITGLSLEEIKKL
jgi:predicted transposase/invertase (TIGR01784 family)